MPATAPPMLAPPPARFLGFRALGFVFLLYSLAQFPLLAFGNSRFWDDWTLFKGSAAITLSIFEQAGVPWVGHFHPAVVQAGWWLYSVITFLCFFWIVVCLAKIALKLGPYHQADRTNGLERVDASK